jgi:hypothetical protein
MVMSFVFGQRKHKLMLLGVDLSTVVDYSK